jgi:hypothetical protein
MPGPSFHTIPACPMVIVQDTSLAPRLTMVGSKGLAVFDCVR